MSSDPRTSPSPPTPSPGRFDRRSSGRPRVGIVVLNYKGWQDTIACLRSLENLAYENWRLYLVDNASPDDSIARLNEAFPDVTVIQNSANLGFGPAHNRALDVLWNEGCDYVWQLNNDAVADPVALRAMVDLAESNSRLGAVGSVIYASQPPDKIVAWGGGRLLLAVGHAWHVYRPDPQLDYLTGASLLIRHKAWQEVGPYDERLFFMWEDADWCLRLRKHGWALAVAPDSRVWHKEGGTEPTVSPFRMYHQALGLVVVLRKHTWFPWFSALPIFAYYALVAWRKKSWAIFREAVRGWCRGWTLPAPVDKE